jgi:poly(hydroxyalkanoate) depolymerase family esterase
MRFFMKVREALSRLAPSRALRSQMIAGWVSGRFPHSLRAGALRPQRDYLLYVPGGVRRRDRVPLLLMLHGCSQDARTLAQGSRMNELAEQQRFLVLYPQQTLRANPFRCWNWFEPRIGRGASEAAEIVALVNAVARRYPIDRSRMYVAGISAGGAMTAILALSYGTLFAACAIVAGVMYGAAESALTGARAMRHGASVSPEMIAEQAARRASRKASFVPALVIHGTDDSVVHPLNAEQIIRQLRRFAEVLGMTAEPWKDVAELRINSAARSYRQRDYLRSNRLLLRSILIEGLGHAWSGGDDRLPFNDSAQPETSRLIWDFCSQFQRPAPPRPPLLRLWLRNVARLWR